MNEHEIIDITKDIAKSNSFLNNSYCGMVAGNERDKAIDYVREQFTKHQELIALNSATSFANPQSYTKYEDLNEAQLYEAIKIIKQTLSGKLLGKSIEELTNGGF